MVHEAGRKNVCVRWRVLGAAVKEGKDLSEKGMTFLGMAVLEDPVRPEVSGTVEEFRHAGVTTVMITDHKDTASPQERLTYGALCDLGVFLGQQ